LSFIYILINFKTLKLHVSVKDKYTVSWNLYHVNIRLKCFVTEIMTVKINKKNFLNDWNWNYDG